MAYKLTQTGNTIIDLDTGANIPVERGNRHFDQAFEVLALHSLVSIGLDGSYTFFPDENLLFDYDKPSLDELKAQAKIEIDNQAGVTRSKYITVAPGQEATYISKEQQARAYKAAGYPASTADYPYIAAEVAANEGDLTATEAADQIIAKADEWAVLGAIIEQTRLAGKRDVDSRIKDTTVIAARDAAIAALQAL